MALGSLPLEQAVQGVMQYLGEYLKLALPRGNLERILILHSEQMDSLAK